MGLFYAEEYIKYSDGKDNMKNEFAITKLEETSRVRKSDYLSK